MLAPKGTRVFQAQKCRKIMVRLRAERKQKVLNVSVKMQSLACFGPNRAGKINETHVLFVSQSCPKIQPLLLKTCPKVFERQCCRESLTSLIFWINLFIQIYWLDIYLHVLYQLTTSNTSLIVLVGSPSHGTWWSPFNLDQLFRHYRSIFLSHAWDAPR